MNFSFCSFFSKRTGDNNGSDVKSMWLYGTGFINYVVCVCVSLSPPPPLPAPPLLPPPIEEQSTKKKTNLVLYVADIDVPQ